jgi:hypothetical protein
VLRGKGVLTVFIHGVKDQGEQVSTKGLIH